MRTLLGSLLLLLFTALLGCGGGGGGTGPDPVRAIMQIVLAGGFPLSTISNLNVTVGNASTAPVAVTTDSNGRGEVTLPPGDYSITASYSVAGVSLSATQGLTLIAGVEPAVTPIVLNGGALAQGWTDYRAGNLDAAITSFESVAASSDPGLSAAGENGLGWALGQQREFNEAISHFTSALTYDADAIDPLVGKAGAHLGRNSTSTDPSDAEALLTTAINLDGSYASGPVHDQILEGDLLISRAFAKILQGNTIGATNDLNFVRSDLDERASPIGVDLFFTVDLLLRD